MTKTFDKIAAQGDLLLIRINELPPGAVLENPKDGKYVASHSETGHAHIIKQCEDVEFYTASNDNMMAYIVVKNDGVLIEHLREFDTHESISFKKGIYEIRRQREASPEGWRVAFD
jgi:hypothetical protein